MPGRNGASHAAASLEPVAPAPASAEPLTILHLSRAAETLWWFLIPTMEAQQRMGHRVLICTEGADADKLERLGFTVIRHGMKRSLNPFGAMRAMWRIRRALRRHRVDALICHNSLAAVAGRIAARIAGTRTVVYFAHGLACGPSQAPLDWLLRFNVERGLAPLTDGLLVMNDYDERLSRRTPLARSSDRVYRIRGMGVDLSRFVPGTHADVRGRLARELRFHPVHAIVLCVARLIPEKGVLDFVAAAKKVCAARRDTVFLLAGTGPLLGELRRRVSQAGLEDRIKILGWREDIQELVKACDVFVLPSYYMEGLPVSLLEAMACGKAIITTHHKGCEDAVEDGVTAYLVPVKQPDRLAERMAQLIGDSTLRERMGRAGRERVERVFELEDCTREVVETLERALHA